jgi:hypothetical protein
MDEFVGGPRRIGLGQDGPRLRVLPSGSNRQLLQGEIEDRHVVCGPVGSGVAGAQDGGQGLLVGVGPGRGAAVSGSPFPQPALRTRRAALTAPGSPRARVSRLPDSIPLPSLPTVRGWLPPGTDSD